MGFADFFRKKASGSIAKDRLKLVLVSDRANCSPEIMEQMKNDIIEVISKYMEIDMEGMDIKISQTDMEDGSGTSGPAIFANIPIREMRGKKRSE
ncbi:MAG: cell division topological specificity factor MinE [Lachnospiraceae bacterium]|nr:cell division topological specificity factor MinE [Lachnospiraceae bacterium]